MAGPHGGTYDGRVPDYDRQIAALLKAHPTLTYIARSDSHVATWMEDDGPQVEVRASQAELVEYLLARFGAR